MASLRDIFEIRKAAGEHAGDWTSDEDGALYNHEYRYIGRLASPDLARFVRDIHNTWLLLMNSWIMQRKALKDRQLITENTNADKR